MHTYLGYLAAPASGQGTSAPGTLAGLQCRGTVVAFQFESGLLSRVFSGSMAKGVKLLKGFSGRSNQNGPSSAVATPEPFLKWVTFAVMTAIHHIVVERAGMRAPSFSSIRSLSRSSPTVTVQTSTYKIPTLWSNSRVVYLLTSDETMAYHYRLL